MRATGDQTFSLRDWFGLVAGITWGLVLSRFFASGDMTGPWLVILFGPPVVLLITPARPLLGWQLPIVTAAVAGTFLNRTADDPGGGALAEATLVWLLCSLLSSPWALVFRYRLQRFRQMGKTPGIPIGYVGMVLLVFVCCALTFLGFVATIYSRNATGARNPGFPFYGWLMATGGIVLSVLTERVARKLEIQKLVRGVFELLMIPGVILGIAAFASLFWFKSPGHPSLDENALCSTLVGMEAMATMFWLTRLDRHEQGRALPS